MLAELARPRGYNALLSGANEDDQGDWRPGPESRRRARRRAPAAATSPRQQVRELARAFDAPQRREARQPVPGVSRIPYGTAVDPETLALIDRAERNVRALGFPVLRVRHHGIMGRLEVDADDLDRALANEHEIVAAIKAAGYRHAVIDREPFRSGRLNAALVRPAASR